MLCDLTFCHLRRRPFILESFGVSFYLCVFIVNSIILIDGTSLEYSVLTEKKAHRTIESFPLCIITDDSSSFVDIYTSGALKQKISQKSDHWICLRVVQSITESKKREKLEMKMQYFTLVSFCNIFFHVVMGYCWLLRFHCFYAYRFFTNGSSKQTYTYTEQ